MIEVILLSLLSVSQSPYRPLPGDPVAERQSIHAKEVGVNPDKIKGQPCAAGESEAKLPFARGRSFCTLGDYLAHLEQQSAIDLPWWREIRPGVFEHVTRMTGATPEIATRAELMKRFGFSR